MDRIIGEDNGKSYIRSLELCRSISLGAIFYILCRVSYLSELVMIETLHSVHNNRLTWHVL